MSRIHSVTIMGKVTYDEKESPELELSYDIQGGSGELAGTIAVMMETQPAVTDLLVAAIAVYYTRNPERIQELNILLGMGDVVEKVVKK